MLKTELRRCVKVEVGVLGSPSLISFMVSVGIKHQQRKKKYFKNHHNNKLTFYLILLSVINRTKF